MSEKLTPKEEARFTESRMKHNAKLIEGGAVLSQTLEQIEALENPAPRERKERKRKTEILRTFSTPDQTEELDFKAFLDKPLFNDFYRHVFRSGFDKKNPYQQMVHDETEPFNKMVYDTAEVFNGVKGRLFQEIAVNEGVGEGAVKEEREIKSIPLNEWCYLITQLTREQLLGNTYYYVQFDDGIVRSIEVHLDPMGDGPYGCSFMFRKLSPQDPIRGYDGVYIKPRIISPAE